jgi:hypothetical protein
MAQESEERRHEHEGKERERLCEGRSGRIITIMGCG